ncbi:DNA-binding PadR family transcriptional regulator [Lipingzhangella halophila]|uniref:DNA-binding PadR family transcriptional regulator n=1 Tax=Lipingzhangella halophila TaxID=1783352 RepID=A0A7W7RDB9_9ACTN|nr:helix-turn-helix transcriptional regulator [Lipingzhangella halophila]MBB4929916.1 DNA-binding PadR family transcriptional regulator [Lipingzhangella halophila]
MSRAERDLASLTVLALLRAGPRHTYEIHRMMVITHKDFVTGLPRSLYYAVDRLSRDGLISAQKTERQGSRPERTLYELTDAGAATLEKRLRLLLATPQRDTALFVAALSFASSLPADAVAQELELRAQRLAEAAESASAPEYLPQILQIEGEFERHRLLNERDWVNTLVDDIRSGAIEWHDVDTLAALIPPEDDAENGNH